MAEEVQNEGTPEGAGQTAKPAESKTPLIVAGLNSLAILACLGMLAYTKIIYQRPIIVESTARKEIDAQLSNPDTASTSTVKIIEPFTVNIKTEPDRVLGDEGPTQLRGKLHYATVGMALEIRNSDDKNSLESTNAIFMDKVLTLLGTKTFQQLSTVQGRYLLRTEIMDIANGLTSDGFVRNIFFTHFVVQ